ncbi:hypothetical protein C8R27_10312 [Nitrosomonas ureae]|uniref:Uncharacterized protein n=1 Tax=Nitrosomonas ureae TaxID=44577 RepID=A0A2T5IEC4_9PROT|nr:hypothetical protein C8R28_102812 [Nitrosomonas ureae]PXX17601.1 hypothetical protein C8R27_10312 [Nitrosomonas ureae]
MRHALTGAVDSLKRSMSAVGHSRLFGLSFCTFSNIRSDLTASVKFIVFYTMWGIADWIIRIIDEGTNSAYAFMVLLH